MLMRLLRALRSAQGEFERGTAAAQAGRLAEALTAMQRAVELRPDFPEAHYNLAAVYRMLGNTDAALAEYGRAAALNPSFAPAHADIGTVLRELHRYEEAERSLRAALALQPDSAGALLELGNVQRALGDWRAALETLQRAVRLDPDNARARWAAAMAEIPAIDDAGADREERRRAFARALDGLESWCASRTGRAAISAVGGAQPFHLAYHEVSNRVLLTRCGRLRATLMQSWQQASGLAPPVRGAPGRRRESRIRIGIVSAHVARHSVWQALVRGWVKEIDRERFELHLFHLGAQRDEQTKFAASHAAALHERKGSLEQWARFIHASRMEVLLYPEVGMDPTTVHLAAMRLAPVQAASWGHPETTGLPSVDYYLSAQALEAPDAQQHYSETLELLPGTGCWLEREDGPRAAVELPKADVLLVCPGMPFKYAPEHDELLAEIARRVPGGRLVFFRGEPAALSARFERRLRAAFDRAGLAFDRHAVFLPWLPVPAFRSLLDASHLYLDTLGFSGFNTALQAVRCGLPVVAREGRFLRGRLASGMLRHIGLDELVATSDFGYVELAVALANDPPRRAALRDRMHAASGRLFEDRAPVRALQGFLERVSA